jgi:hypothetical protein
VDDGDDGTEVATEAVPRPFEPGDALGGQTAEIPRLEEVRKDFHGFTELV